MPIPTITSPMCGVTDGGMGVIGTSDGGVPATHLKGTVARLRTVSRELLANPINQTVPKACISTRVSAIFGTIAMALHDV